jgi:general secretion pathway protein L
LDFLASPEKGFQLILSGNNILVNQENGSPWFCNINDFNWLVQKKLAESEDDLSLEIPLEIIAENDFQDEAYLFQNNLPAGRFQSNLTMTESTDLWLLEKGNNKLNLLQGEFAVKNESFFLKEIGLKVATILGVLLCAHILYQGSLWFTLEQENKLLSEQKASLWKKAFPGKKYVETRANKQFKGFINQIGNSGDNIFLPLLDQTSKKLSSLEKIYPTSLNFDASRSELRMDIIAKDLSILNQYRDDLKASGLKVETNSATQRSEGYSSRLIIRR